jgi:hypothetical protein
LAMDCTLRKIRWSRRQSNLNHELPSSSNSWHQDQTWPQEGYTIG